MEEKYGAIQGVPSGNFGVMRGFLLAAPTLEVELELLEDEDEEVTLLKPEEGGVALRFIWIIFLIRFFFRASR